MERTKTINNLKEKYIYFSNAYNAYNADIDYKDKQVNSAIIEALTDKLYDIKSILCDLDRVDFINPDSELARRIIRIL